LTEAPAEISESLCLEDLLATSDKRRELEVGPDEQHYTAGSQGGPGRKIREDRIVLEPCPF
jgi:hypothetical protein